MLTLLWHMQKAVATRLKPEDMVSTIFIFSDMEFDSAYTDVSSGNEFYGGSTYRDVPSRYPQRVERTTYESVKVNLRRVGMTWCLASMAKTFLRR